MKVERSQPIPPLKQFHPVLKENKDNNYREVDLKQKIRIILGDFKDNQLTKEEAVNRLYQIFNHELEKMTRK